MMSYFDKPLLAVEASNSDKESESNITSSTKKVLRKVGRKARDESCEWTEDKMKCKKEQAEHRQANLNDKIDSKKRKMEQAKKEYEEAVNEKVINK